MKKIAIVLNLVLAIIFTSSVIEAQQKSKEKSVVSELFPKFTVEVKLTPAAEKKLKDTKKTITVRFEFGNDLGPDSPNAIYPLIEINGAEKFSTERLKISNKELKKLGDNYDVGISIHSTHKKKNDLNFLDCKSTFDNSTSSNIKQYLNKNIVITCDLLKLD